MKLFILVLSFLVSASLRGQVINGGFEEWDGQQAPGWSFSEGGSEVDAHSGLSCFHVKLLQWSDFLSNTTPSTRGWKIPYGKSRLSMWVFAPFVMGTTYFGYLLTYYHNGIPIRDSSIHFYSNSWQEKELAVFNIKDSSSQDSIGLLFWFYHKDMKKATEIIDFYIDDVSFQKIEDASAPQIAIECALQISNPISTHANLRYTLSGTAAIHASLYDVTGREVLQLPLLERASGSGSIPFDVDELPNGFSYLK